MRSLELRFGQFETQHHVRILAALIFELVIKPVRDRAEERRRPAPILQTRAERFDFGSASVQRGPHRERGKGGAAAGGEGKEVPMRLRPDPSGSIARFRIFRDENIFVILDYIQGSFARRENVIPTLRYEFDELRRRGIVQLILHLGNHFVLSRQGVGGMAYDPHPPLWREAIENGVRFSPTFHFPHTDNAEGAGLPGVRYAECGTDFSLSPIRTD